MFKSGASKRYQGFLNDCVEAIQVGIFPSMAAMVRKYGISSTFSAFLIDKGIFHRTGDSKNYKYSVGKDVKPNFTEESADELRKEFNVWKYNQKHLNGEFKPTTKVESKFQHFTTKQLVTELKRRGYTGSLYIKKEIKI
jgi:hypothetical protein